MAKPDTVNSFIYRKRKLSEFDFRQPVNVYDDTATFPTTNRVSENQGGGSGNHAGAIAAGVIVPVLILLIIGAIIYYWYRKKYPVRMIFGKDFGKFSNPSYEKRVSTLTLTREEPFEEAYKKDIETFAASQEVSTEDENVDYINEQQYQPTKLSFIQRMSASDFPGQSPEPPKRRKKATDEDESKKTNIKSKILNKVKGSQKSLNDKNESVDPEEEENARQAENNMIENAEQMIVTMKKKIIPVDAGSESSDSSTENEENKQTSDGGGSIKQQEKSDREPEEKEDKEEGDESTKKPHKIKITVDKDLVSDQDTPGTTNDLQKSESDVSADDNVTSGEKLDTSDTNSKVENKDIVDARDENKEDGTENQSDIEEIDSKDARAGKDSSEEKDNKVDIPEMAHEVEVKETYDVVEISEVQSSEPPLQHNDSLKNNDEIPQNNTSNLSESGMGLQDNDNQNEQAAVNNEKKENKDFGLITVPSTNNDDSLTGSHFVTFPAADDLQDDPALLPASVIQADDNGTAEILLSGAQNINNKTISIGEPSNSESDLVHGTLSPFNENDKTDVSLVENTPAPDVFTPDDNSISEPQFEIIQTGEHKLQSDDNNDLFQITAKQSSLSEQSPEQATPIISTLTANEQNTADLNTEEQNTSKLISDEWNSLQSNSMEENFVKLDSSDVSGFQSSEQNTQFSLNNKILQPDGNNDIIHLGSDKKSEGAVLFGADEQDGMQISSNYQNKRLYENVNVQFPDSLTSSSFKPFADEVDFGEAAEVDLTKTIEFENKDFSFSEQKDLLNQDNDSIASGASSSSSYSERLVTRKKDTDSLNNFGSFGSFEILNKEEDNDSSSIGDASLKNFSSLSSDTDRESENTEQQDSKPNKERREIISVDNPSFDFGMSFKLADKNGGSATDLTDKSLDSVKFEGFPIESPGFEAPTPWIPDTDASSRVLRRRESITVDNPFFDVEGAKTDDGDKNSFVIVDASSETSTSDTSALSNLTELQQLDFESNFGKPLEQIESVKPLTEQEVHPMKKITFNLNEINDSDVSSSDDESNSGSSNEVAGSYSIQGGDDAIQHESSEA